MRRTLLTAAGVAALLAWSAGAEKPLPLTNPGFEDDLAGWACGDTMSSVLAAAARSGTRGLRVTDDDTVAGSNLRSPHVPVMPGKTYAVRLYARSGKSAGTGIYLEFFNAAGAGLNTPDRKNQNIVTVPDGQTEWAALTVVGEAPDEAATMTVWIHSFNGAVGTVDIDDVELVELTAEEAAKVKTEETEPREFNPPTSARIAEIADMLGETPGGGGAPIGDRTRWDALAAAEDARKLIDSAAGYIDTPPPELPDDLYLEFSRNGNRTNYQRPYGQASGRIEAMLKAECLENRGRFLPALERDILAMCDERSWVMPAHDARLTNFNGTALYIDLGSGARGWLLATADYWLGDRLSAAVRSRIRAEVEKRIFTPYLTALREGRTLGNWWMRGTNNWNAVCNACVTGTGLALIEDKALRAEFLAGAEVSNPYFLSGFTDDGYCSEGMGYWNYGFGHYMLLGHMALEATGGKLDMFTDPKIPNIARYPFNIMIQPDLAPAFADCGVGSRPGSDVLALIRPVFPDAVPGGAPARGPLGGGTTYFGIAAFRPDADAAADSGADMVLPLRTWFADAGILITRSAPGAPRAFGAAFKGGHNAEHHNHNDVGSLVVASDGKTYLLDPGGEVYTRRTFSSQRYVSNVLNSYGHPVPVVAGKLQSTGGRARARVLAAEFTDAADTLKLDLRSAYAADGLRTLERTFVHHRAEPRVVVTDAVEFDAENTFETALVTYEKVYRRDENTFVVYDTNGAVIVDVEVRGGEWEYRLEEIENPGRPSPKRLGFALRNPVRQATVTFSIRPSDVPDDVPGVYRAPDENAFRPVLEQTLTVEAEAFSSQEGGTVEVSGKTGASGKALKFWDDENHALTWTFDVPRPGRYAIRVRQCNESADPVTRKILVDGKPVGDRSVAFPSTGGWSSDKDDWHDTWLAVAGKAVLVDLAAGKHALTLVNDCGIGLNVDRVDLVPAR